MSRRDIAAECITKASAICVREMAHLVRGAQAGPCSAAPAAVGPGADVAAALAALQADRHP